MNKQVFRGGIDLHQDSALHLRGIDNYKKVESIHPKRSIFRFNNTLVNLRK